MSKLLLLAVLAAVVWFWWKGKSERLGDAGPARDAARLLGVRDDAGADDIRAAWRRKVAALRPDATGDAATLQSLTEARDLLLARATGRPLQ